MCIYFVYAYSFIHSFGLYSCTVLRGLIVVVKSTIGNRSETYTD